MRLTIILDKSCSGIAVSIKQHIMDDYVSITGDKINNLQIDGLSIEKIKEYFNKSGLSNFTYPSGMSGMDYVGLDLEGNLDENNNKQLIREFICSIRLFISLVEKEFQRRENRVKEYKAYIEGLIDDDPNICLE